MGYVCVLGFQTDSRRERVNKNCTNHEFPLGRGWVGGHPQVCFSWYMMGVVGGRGLVNCSGDWNCVMTTSEIEQFLPDFKRR